MLVVPGRRLRLRGAAGADVQLPVPLRASQLPGALAGAPAKHELVGVVSLSLPWAPDLSRVGGWVHTAAVRWWCAGEALSLLPARPTGLVRKKEVPHIHFASTRQRLHATDQMKGDGGECLDHHHHPSFTHPLPPARPHTPPVSHSPLPRVPHAQSHPTLTPSFRACVGAG